MDWIHTLHFIHSSDGSITTQILHTENPTRPRFVLDSTGGKTKGHIINSVLFETEAPFNLEKLELLLQSALFIYYREVYRIKGYVKNHTGNIYLVQSAGKTLDISDSTEPIEKSQLVFIGPGLTLKTVESLLCTALQ